MNPVRSGATQAKRAVSAVCPKKSSHSAAGSRPAPPQPAKTAASAAPAPIPIQLRFVFISCCISWTFAREQPIVAPFRT